MNGAKIQLSEEELQLVMNADWLLTKNAIIAKVYGLFGVLAEQLQQRFLEGDHPFPEEVLALSPKISRGEQYGGLPYVMLDYPRYFTRHDQCALRTFFWWGHFFSVTLQLKGKWQRHFSDALGRHYDLLDQNGFRLCVNDSEWRHDWEKDNYVPLGQYLSASPEKLPADRPFCKLSSGIPLSSWNEAEPQIGQLYQVILASLV